MRYVGCPPKGGTDWDRPSGDVCWLIRHMVGILDPRTLVSMCGSYHCNANPSLTSPSTPSHETQKGREVTVLVQVILKIFLPLFVLLGKKDCVSGFRWLLDGASRYVIRTHVQNAIRLMFPDIPFFCRSPRSSVSVDIPSISSTFCATVTTWVDLSRTADGKVIEHCWWQDLDAQTWFRSWFM